MTVWGGWSLHWYGELFANEQLLDAIGVTLMVAVLSSTLALVLGTFAGIVLARFARFRGRTPFLGLVIAPIVVPGSDHRVGPAAVLRVAGLGARLSRP